MEVSRYQFVFKMNPPVCLIFFFLPFFPPSAPPQKTWKDSIIIKVISQLLCFIRETLRKREELFLLQRSHQCTSCHWKLKALSTGIFFFSILSFIYFLLFFFFNISLLQGCKLWLIYQPNTKTELHFWLCCKTNWFNSLM